MIYKIGQFSKITMLTVKTLRYYHEKGLLVPIGVSDENNYRHYSESQIETAKLIKMLKTYEFTINEILEILENSQDASDIQAYLDEKYELFEQEIQRYESLKKEIKSYIHPKEVTIMNDALIERIQIEDKRIISVTYKGRYQDVGQYMGILFKAAGSSVAGKPFCIYHDMEYREEATIEVCVEVKKEINKTGVDFKMLKGGSGVSIIHTGSYDNLGDTYKAITDYMNENNLVSDIPSREIYLKGPGMLLKGNPAKYKTEIQYILTD